VPQRLINSANDLYKDDVVQSLFQELVASHNVDLSDVRLLVRPSGTEPVVRVMIEALDGSFVDEFSSRLESSFS